MPTTTDDLTLGDDLRAFLDASPTPFHAVAELTRRLTAAGFTELAETDRWAPQPGGQHFVVRSGSLIAFRVGRAPLAEAGLRMVGVHTDSPTFRVRPRSDVRQAGYRLVGVEPYGGALWHTWLDRELTAAGRLAFRDGGTALVRLPGAPLRLPSLAIHLDRSVREGLTLDPQRHLVPVWASDDLDTEPGLLEALAAAAGVPAIVPVEDSICRSGGSPVADQAKGACPPLISIGWLYGFPTNAGARTSVTMSSGVNLSLRVSSVRNIASKTSLNFCDALSANIPTRPDSATTPNGFTDLASAGVPARNPPLITE